MADIESTSSYGATGQVVPILPLRDVVVYPHMVIPLFVGREKSIRALESAMAGEKHILLVAQRSAEVDDPGRADIYDIGTVANILQLLKLPDGTIKVLVEGVRRAQLTDLVDEGEYFSARLAGLVAPEVVDERESEVLGGLPIPLRRTCPSSSRRSRRSWKSRRFVRGSSI